jgi:hypothetical protein
VPSLSALVATDSDEHPGAAVSAKQLRVAIVGLGPWGLCALERLITAARRGLPGGVSLEVHVVEPRQPGSGVYDLRQPDYLLLNNPCGQISMFPFEDQPDQPPYAVGFYDWVLASGYRWVGGRCVKDPTGRPIEPNHFLPRRLMGEYLAWFYGKLISSTPSSVSVVHHQCAAVDLVARVDGTELVCLSDGQWLLVDHVIVTSGHTANQESNEVVPRPREMPPFPVSDYVDLLPARSSVGISGFGLVAVDVVTALTIGRGGSYRERSDGRLEYVASGREPRLTLYSRSGLPFAAKSVTGVDRSDVYTPIVCTPDAFAALTKGSNGARRRIDVRGNLLPLLFAEMYARYYAQTAYRAGGIEEGAGVRRDLKQAWHDRRFQETVAELAGRYGSFDPAQLFFGPDLTNESSADYQQVVYRMMEDDLREAEVPNGFSAIKSAAEVFRIFRDPMRSVVEYGGLSLDSYLDFNADLRTRITRLVAGPPALRSRQFLALMDSGVLSIPYGPAPAVGTRQAGTGEVLPGARIGSTLLTNRFTREVDVLIRGHLEEPRIDGSASLLLSRLYDEGRVSQFRYGTVTVGSVDLTPEAHPISVDGRVQERLWMFGVLTEGVRHFTHYIPSPRSRMRAVEDIGDCVATILGA